MHKTKQVRVVVFFVLITITATLVYVWRSGVEERAKQAAAEEQARLEETKRKEEERVLEQRRQADRLETARRQREEKEARERMRQVQLEKERVQFVNQYVNTNIFRKPGVPLVSVAVASENNTMNHGVSAALIRRFSREQAQLVDSFFKPPLVSEGLFKDVFNGSTELFSKLAITNLVDALLLGRQEVQYTKNVQLNDVITANMRIELVTLPVAGQIQSQGWTFTANGVGFREAEARMQAEERILKQIADKPDMSLGFTGSKR